MMAEQLPGPAVEKRLIFEQEGSKCQLLPHAPVDSYYEALVTGNLKKLKALTGQYYEDVNMVFEISKSELEWQVKSQAAFGLSGLWSLEYKRDLTNPLCISASHGHTACLRHLLFWRADPNAAPGGRSALHEACERGHTDCTELLLEHKANPNLLSHDGQAPLHLCTNQNTLGCAKALVRFGALVNQPSEEFQETPLHIAARHGLYHHLHLYLRYGATVDKKNSLEETALSVACKEAKKVENQEIYLQVCKRLLEDGAEVNTVDEEVKSPLHKACRNAHHNLVQLLLQKKADVNAIDYNGASPMSCILQAAAFQQEQKRPHLTVQTLLNYGSQKIWPTAFVKKHLPFYKSFLNQMSTVRCLQHLCRCAIRRRFNSRCHDLIPLLPVPKPLQSYLLLEPEGILL
ncbi:ankyrin repeat and SOCS box protein 18 isoform X2 [Hemicordylus capensis]|uniref:ankyrin repeat and SOCS box protein 18 isoform X2 n=1 Tax=Hemicordylus capensis TaxID=884348 RepID=UPI0023034767|nr:ankyrin repeat and SOCS box protein 18 isoform X2 [Hemicordylus capensis]